LSTANEWRDEVSQRLAGEAHRLGQRGQFLRLETVARKIAISSAAVWASVRASAGAFAESADEPIADSRSTSARMNP